jgi:hypothetical protein
LQTEQALLERLAELEKRVLRLELILSIRQQEGGSRS